MIGIISTGGSSVTITNCHFENCGTAVYAENSSVSMDGGSIINCENGVTLRNCSDSTIENVFIHYFQNRLKNQGLRDFKVNKLMMSLILSLRKKYYLR